jgi:hypothetical protein
MSYGSKRGIIVKKKDRILLDNNKARSFYVRAFAI